jgi:hypothetical protein
MSSRGHPPRPSRGWQAAKSTIRGAPPRPSAASGYRRGAPVHPGSDSESSEYSSDSDSDGDAAPAGRSREALRPSGAPARGAGAPRPGEGTAPPRPGRSAGPPRPGGGAAPPRPGGRAGPPRPGRAAQPSHPRNDNLSGRLARGRPPSGSIPLPRVGAGSYESQGSRGRSSTIDTESSMLSDDSDHGDGGRNGVGSMGSHQAEAGSFASRDGSAPRRSWLESRRVRGDTLDGSSSSEEESDSDGDYGAPAARGPPRPDVGGGSRHQNGRGGQVAKSISGGAPPRPGSRAGPSGGGGGGDGIGGGLRAPRPNGREAAGGATQGAGWDGRRGLANRGRMDSWQSADRSAGSFSSSEEISSDSDDFGAPAPISSSRSDGAVRAGPRPSQGWQVAESTFGGAPPRPSAAPPRPSGRAAGPPRPADQGAPPPVGQRSPTVANGRKRGGSGPGVVRSNAYSDDDDGDSRYPHAIQSHDSWLVLGEALVASILQPSVWLPHL